MNELTVRIISRCDSRAEALAYLRDFSQAATEKLFSKDRQQRSGNESDFDPELWKLVDRKNFHELVLQSEGEIKTLPVLTVYLATHLPGPQTRIIAADLKSVDGSQYLLDFKIDPSLIAGCALVWEGKYGDFSVRRIIDERKEEIRKLVLT